MKNFNFFIALTLLNVFLFVYFLWTQIYPWPLALLQISSIITLASLYLPWKRIWQLFETHQLDAYIVIVLFVLSMFVRMYRVREITPGMWGDEVTGAQIALNLQKSPNFVPFVPTNFGHPTPLLYATSASISVMGKSFTSIRLVSMVFGALGVIVFYLFLRNFFPSVLASIGSLIFSLAYGNIIISRLGYEMTASLFFQIVSYFILYLFWKKKKPKYLILLGISLGLGLWTYLSFRLIALSILLLVSLAIWKNLGKKELPKNIVICLISLGITTVMISSYALKHPSEMNARVSSVSIFNKGLPPSEIAKEFIGSTEKTFSVFWLGGDPNPRQNPSSTSYFDIVTILLFFFGSYWLIRKDRNYLVIGGILLTPLLLNDILAVELISEFHYYGIGHPHTLRISGILPIVYLVVIYGIKKLTGIFLKGEKKKIFASLMAGAIVIPILVLNWHSYFQQPFNDYIYETNGLRQYQATLAINNLKTNHIILSPSLKNDPRYQFFVNPRIVADDFVPKTSTVSALKLNSGDVVILDPSQDPVLANSIIEEIKNHSGNLFGAFVTNPKGQVDTIVFSKR